MISLSTSPASHFVPLQVSPAGLLGRFAPSALRALRSHSRSLCSLGLHILRSRKFPKKESVSQSTQNGLKRVKMQKKTFTPLTRFARSAASAASGEAQPLPLRSLRSLGLRASRSHSQSIGLRASHSRLSVASLPRASRSLPTPCHSQGPKECPCQVSCRSDQNCGR